VNTIFFSVVFFVSDLIGLPSYLYIEGLRLFQFWR
jgi:hypothetical protein